MAQELWIRLEEGEATFAELATTFGEGSEASRKGLFGPMPMGNINSPDVKSILRSLQPGHVHPPTKFGDWVVLIRLENLSPARFDDDMRKFLLNQKLDEFLDQRVKLILAGQSPIHLILKPKVMTNSTSSLATLLHKFSSFAEISMISWSGFLLTPNLSIVALDNSPITK